MRKIIGIGETILDIIFQDEQPTSATPGGSVFNGLITLGRLKSAGDPDFQGAEASQCGEGIRDTPAPFEVCFVSDVGRDRVGDLICRFMEQNGVSSRWVNRHPSAKTAVSLAFLDQNHDADYTFFKDYSYEGLQGEFPDITADDLVVFGSYYALNPLLRPRMKAFLEKARQAGALIYYDVNFRKSHSYEAGYLEPVLRENFAYADILRGSEDDFRALYGGTLSPIDIYQNHIAPRCAHFIHTAGPGGISLQTPSLSICRQARRLEPLSTVGAGDNFNAGVLYGLIREGVSRRTLPLLNQAGWNRILDYALDFSAAVCRSYENYISPEMARRYRR